jgi:hypothetical protein
MHHIIGKLFLSGKLVEKMETISNNHRLELQLQNIASSPWILKCLSLYVIGYFILMLTFVLNYIVPCS